MTKTVSLVHGNEVAVVTLNGEGRVEVSREGMGVAVMAAGLTLDSIVSKFEKSGWQVAVPTQPQAIKEEPKMDLTKVAKAALAQGVTVEIQQEVDAYLKLHEAKAALEKQLEAHKKVVRNYMEENGVTAISGTEGKQVYLQDAKASNATSDFSDYELTDIMAVLPEKELLQQVTEMRVSTKKLEGLLSLDKLPKAKVAEIKALKIVKAGTPRFAVKK